MHLQLFPAYLISLLTVGVAAVTWQWKRMSFPSIQGKTCHIREPSWTTDESRVVFMQEQLNQPFRRVPKEDNVLISEFLKGEFKKGESFLSEK